MTYKQFNNYQSLEAYLLEEFTAGTLSEVAKYGFTNAGCGELIYTSNAINAAVHFSDSIREIYAEHDIDPLDTLSRYDRADLREIATHFLYRAIDIACWPIDTAVEDVKSDLDELVSEYGLSLNAAVEDELNNLIYDLFLEDNGESYEEQIRKAVRELLEERTAGTLNNHIHLRLLGCGGSFHTIEADDAYDLAAKWVDFSEDYCGAYKVLGGCINGEEVEEGASVSDLISYYY